jgi:hypothetical protein
MVYLGEAYLENLEKNKYQFAFKAFHMLYMVFMYKTSWFIRKINNDKSEVTDFKLKINDDGKVVTMTEKILIEQLFQYSCIGEYPVILSLLKKKHFHPNDFSKCQHHVDARNHCSHACGKIEYDEKGIDFLIHDELKYVEKLQKELEPELKKFLEIFLGDNWDKEYVSGDFEILFEENHLSIKDLESISSIKLDLFKKKSDNLGIIKQKILYLQFIFEIQNRIDEDNLFLDKLHMLMIGLPESVEIGEEKDKIEVPISKLLEKSIMSIISTFSDSDRKKAEKILNKSV